MTTPPPPDHRTQILCPQGTQKIPMTQNPVKRQKDRDCENSDDERLIISPPSF